jgi:hypothetical protein
MSLRFAIVCEARDDFEIASALADRVFVETHDWLEAILDHNRAWVGCDGLRFVTWTNVKIAARVHNLRAWGQFDGAPGEADAVAGRRALILLRRLYRPSDKQQRLHGVLLLRDVDKQSSRLTGLRQAADEGRTPGWSLLISVVNTKRECWVLNGFVPENDDERTQLAIVRTELGFDPTLGGHDLTATGDAKRSAKRVLALLTNGDRVRERRCWAETALKDLVARGTTTGLTNFLVDVRENWSPLFVSSDD